MTFKDTHRFPETSQMRTPMNFANDKTRLALTF